MLVMLRNVKQIIKIGHDIEVKILCIKGSVVRVGIDAPKAVHIHRKEIYERMNKNDPKKMPFKKSIQQGDENHQERNSHV